MYRFPFVVSNESPVLPGARVMLDDAIPNERVFANSMQLPDGTPATSVTDDGEYVKAEHLQPQRDGTNVVERARGVQMKIIKDGLYKGVVVWVDGKYGPARLKYTLWLRNPSGGVDVVQFTRDEIVPLHSPFTETGFPPTCVSMIMSQTSEGKTKHDCVGFIAPVVSLTNPEQSHPNAYDPNTGKVMVNAGTIARRLVTETKSFTTYQTMSIPEVEKAIEHIDGSTDPGDNVIMRVPWYGLIPLRLPYVSWGKVVRLFSLSPALAHLTGKLATINKIWRDDKHRPWVEVVPLDPALGGPVVIPEGHCAPAEVMPTALDLYEHIKKVPQNFHSLERMVVFTAVNAEKIDLESKSGYIHCDYDKLLREFIGLGRRPPHWWKGLSMHCVRMFCEQKIDIRDADGNVVEQLTMSDDPHHVELTVRAIRGLAEHCWRCEMDVRQEQEQSEHGWAADVLRPHNDATKRPAKKKKTKKKKKKKSKRKKH